MPAPRALLVYGWYGRGNAGDELMKLALQRLLGQRGVEPTFVDRIDEGNLAQASGVIFGGGSILYNDPVISPKALAMLRAGKVPVFYVGVGGETGPSPIHERLINTVARIVAFRELDVPDLVYSLQADGSALAHPPKGLLFVPNVELLPTHEDPHWMHAAWEHFKNEAAQALDRHVDRGLPVSFMLMCKNDRKDDGWAAAEIIGRMKRRSPGPAVYQVQDLYATRLMRHFRVVITQRYHGIVLAEMSGTPYVSIDHHDKLRHAWPHRGGHVSYYGFQKDPFTDAVTTALANPIVPHRAPPGVHDDLIDQIVAQLAVSP